MGIFCIFLWRMPTRTVKINVDQTSLWLCFIAVWITVSYAVDGFKANEGGWVGAYNIEPHVRDVNTHVRKI